MAETVGTGVNRRTGRVLSGWRHVEQSLGVIFTTAFGERVMREFFGSAVPKALGDNLVPSTLLRVYTAMYAALVYEPRFRLIQVGVVSSASDLRVGNLKIKLVGIYMPRGHLGDFTPEGRREMVWSAK